MVPPAGQSTPAKRRRGRLVASSVVFAALLGVGIVTSTDRVRRHEKHIPRTISRAASTSDWLSSNSINSRGLSKSSRRLNSPFLNNDDKSAHFPPSSEVVDMVELSFLMYTLKDKVYSCDDEEGIVKRFLPKNTTCILYSHDMDQGTQVMVVRSDVKKFIGVVYAGTDNWKTTLTDGNILLSSFGEDPNESSGSGADDNSNNSGSKNGNKNLDPRGWKDKIPSDVKIHRGFNYAVFAGGGFDLVLDAVRSAQNGMQGEYRLFTTGHSLGAADSVITAVGLYLTFPKKVITSINFGCPKIGNHAWTQWVNSLAPSSLTESKDGGNDDMGGVNVYRFVNGRDAVPRLPEYPFTHTGHTIQIDHQDRSCCKAYYHHVGDESLGYAGVPRSWDLTPLIWIPNSIKEHRRSYVRILSNDEQQPNSSYFQEFVRFNATFEEIIDATRTMTA